ncbi:unnamed protein product [Oikopleura dioica]|uniref:Uncharacterized protein n=1 Tax=Oikopleura dioica TaxID=34765 RepID=E4YPE5_OIKDI|nr:unnamed protein product [Oikopleura dioica]
MPRRNFTLEQVARENGPHAFEHIQKLLEDGANPLEPNSQKLFPFHFAQSNQIFEALTEPPVDCRSYMLTLARSKATEKEKIRILTSALQNKLVLAMNFTDQENMTCIGIAAQRREYRFAQAVGIAIKEQDDRHYGPEQEIVKEFIRMMNDKDAKIRGLQDRLFI